MAIAAVAIGVAGYALTTGPKEAVEPSAVATTGPTATATPSAKPSSKATTPPSLNRAEFQVAVYNHTTVAGLAKRTSTKLSTMGWNVVSTLQWNNNIDASTVFFGPGLETAAKQLATDLGITKTAPAIDPMARNQVTVILADDYTP